MKKTLEKNSAYGPTTKDVLEPIYIKRIYLVSTIIVLPLN